MTLAIMRQVSRRLADCEITYLDRMPIDVETARAQHRQYVHVLQQLSCHVIELPEEADLPDSVFVEDTAIILPEVAVITRPGADSRKPETESIVRVLSPLIKILRLREPAALDGGDVLVLGKKIYVGLSTRSNQAAVDQLNELLREYGYTVKGIRTHGCLHLKSAVTRVDDRTLLINKNWVDPSCFAAFELIEVDPSEPSAANCLSIQGSIIFPASFPKTHRKLEERGYNIIPVDLSELAKAEGAVTCCSLIIEKERP